jgi:uncharacterized protein (DUF58 family)
VELRRCTRGTGLLAILLLTGALLLDDPAVFFAGSAILAGLVIGYLRFDRLSRGTVRSVVISRSLERTRIRKGTTTRVSTDITLKISPRMHVTVTELIPAGVAVQDGVPSLELTGSEANDTYRIRYRITPLVHGTLPVRGISLTLRDVFFQTSFALTAERYSGPLLQVLPRGDFKSAQKHSTMETREIEKMSVMSGFGIRNLREYFAGDNIRDIDWKLSAKYDKLFIREYTGIVNLPPVLVIDLPWSGQPFSAPEFDRMVGAVAGLAEHSVRKFQYATLIVVSGPNILQVIEEEKDLQQGMTLLREWLHPAERLVHWYRIPDRSLLREQIRHLDQCIQDGEDAHARAFFTTLQKKYQQVLPSQRPTAFSTDIARVLSSVATDEMVIFSLGEGDLSHLREVIRQAKTMKFGVHLRMPIAASPLPGQSFSGRFGADSVEAFA